MKKRFTRYLIFFVFLLLGAVMSCQKDEAVKDDTSTSAAVDSSLIKSNATGNYLAVKGNLKITIQDSTYSFDAEHDSVAFVNVQSGESQYFGISAINKAHNMSFGISSAGYAVNNSSNAVAGSQFLFQPDNKQAIQFSLTKYAESADFGKLVLTSFKKDSVLAKGTFYTFLTKDEKPNSPFYKVKGSFSLKLK